MPGSLIIGSGVSSSLNFLRNASPSQLLLGAAFGSAGTSIGGLLVKPKPKNPQFPDFVFNRTQTLRQPVTSWQWIYGQVRVGGSITFVECSANNQTLHLVITLAGHEVEEIGDIWCDDEVVPLDGSGNATGRFAGYVLVQKSRGNEIAGVQPFPDLVTASASNWTSAHRQTGRAKIYVRLTWNQDLFPQGIPQITAVVKGRKVYDPRTVTTAYSSNAALCVADYLMSAVGLGCALAEIDTAQLTAAANTCDEDVALSAGGTEKRYTMNGAFASSVTPRETLPRLNTALAGYTRFIGGLWGVYAGVYATPTITLTQDDLRGAIRTLPRLSKRDLCNKVKGLYVNPDKNWQPDDYPPVTNAAYVTEDQGESIPRELDLPFTTSGARAQRVAKIELERTRQQITIEWPGKLTCYRLQAGDTVYVTLSRYGYSAKVFEVVSSTLTFDEVEGGVVLGCDLVLRETASSVYSWTAASEEQIVDPAPDTVLPDPFTVAAPTSVAFGETDYMLTGEGNLTWIDSTSAWVKEYDVEYKISSASAWTSVPPVLAGAQKKRLTGLPVEAYKMRVRAVSTIGPRSSWAPSSAGLAVTLAAPTVPMVSGLELFGQALGTTFGGRDAKFVWRAASQQDSYGIGSEPAGAGSGAVDPYFKDYLVRIYESNGSTLRREEPLGAVTEPKYSYVYEKNQEDGSGTPIRSGVIKIWQRGRQNQLSAYPAQMPFSNPQAGVPATLSLRAEFNALYVEWTPPSDLDVAGVIINVSTSTGFTPSGTAPGAGNCYYNGPDRLVVIDNAIAANTAYYVRVACYDAFGVDSLTYASELSITTPQIATVDLGDLTVTTAKIANLGVTLAKLAADSVDNTKIVDLSVGTTELALSAVTTTKIADDAITTPKLVALAVTTGKIDALAITTAKINAGAVTSTEIAALTITAGNIASSAVTTAKLDAGAVTTAKITAGAITTNELGANVVTAAKIFAGTITTTEIAANTITAANIAAATITGSKIAAGTITASNMVAGTITAASAILADAVITTAKIDDLQVTTLKIGNNAVTIPTTAYTAGAQAFTNAAIVTIQQVTFTSTGAPVLLHFSAEITNSNVSDEWFSWQVLKDGAVFASNNNVFSKGGVSTMFFSFSLTDTPTAASHTYKFELVNLSANTLNAWNRTLLALECKK